MSRAAATRSEEGVQGAEADALYSSVNDDIWYKRSGVALYRICLFVPAVTVEELGILHNL